MFGLYVRYSDYPKHIGVDYFTAQQDGNGEYVQLVEKFHIDVVPGQIKENALSQAILDLSYALDRVPNHPVALHLMAQVGRLSNKSFLAVQRFQKAINQFPKYAISRTQFGGFLIAIGSVDEGLVLFKQSTEIEPKFAGGYAGLAQAYARKGDLERAREAATKARELGFEGQLPGGM